MSEDENKKRQYSRGRTVDGEPNPVDVHVGSRVRLRRTLLNMSQEKLGNALGLTFQQVQKYERGMNRIGASRLWDLAKVLSVPISFFYDDMKEGVALQSPRMINSDEVEYELAEEQDVLGEDPMNKKEAIELVRAFYKIADRETAQNLYDLIISLSKR